MGAYSNLFIEGELVFSREYISYELVALFDKEDIINKKIKTQKEVPFPIEDYWEEDGVTEVTYFECSSSKINDKLRILGFTKDKIETRFHKALDKIIKEEKEYYEQTDNNTRLEYLVDLNYEKFAKELCLLYKGTSSNKLLNEYLISELCGHDMRIILAISLSRQENEVDVIYDITDIVYSEPYFLKLEGAVDKNNIYESIIEEEATPFEDRYGEKIIVLTEGPTDSEYLKRSLDLLYPHLSRFYGFLDYKLFKVPSGAGNLGNTLKAFVAVGLTNRVIAIFDNDSAANSVINSLKVDLPPNFRILQYPDIEILNNYPSIGPLGENRFNINGYAGSIELYLGKDALSTKDGTLEPVRWGGYDPKTKKYQATIINKDIVQKRFKRVLKSCEDNESNIDQYDFSGVDEILNVIFDAFNE